MMGQKLDHEELSGQKRGGRLRGLPAPTPRRAGLRTRPASALQLQPRRGSGDRPCPHTVRDLDSLRASPFSSADIEAGSLPVGASRRPWGVEQHPRPQPLDSRSASSPV